MARRARKAPKPAHPYFLGGAGKVPGVSYGVLRSTYKGTANSTLGFVAGKLHLADAASAVWQPTATRHDVIMPARAPTLWWEPRELWASYEGARHNGC